MKFKSGMIALVAAFEFSGYDTMFVSTLMMKAALGDSKDILDLML